MLNSLLCLRSCMRSDCLALPRPLLLVSRAVISPVPALLLLLTSARGLSLWSAEEAGAVSSSSPEPARLCMGCTRTGGHTERGAIVTDRGGGGERGGGGGGWRSLGVALLCRQRMQEARTTSEWQVVGMWESFSRPQTNGARKDWPTQLSRNSNHDPPSACSRSYTMLRYIFIHRPLIHLPVAPSTLLASCASCCRITGSLTASAADVLISPPVACRASQRYRGA